MNDLFTDARRVLSNRVYGSFANQVIRSLEGVSLAEISNQVQPFAARGASASAMHQAPSEGTNG
ncbi:MAG: hypothetical protein O7D31_07195 [Alphaproteobacteria bacterium]|nr:hypothetical protein [Alphaproteobacteria bacterium]